MEGALIAYAAFILIGLALFIGTMKALLEWRRSTSKFKSSDNFSKKAFAYGFFAMAANASLGIIMFGAISILNHAGK